MVSWLKPLLPLSIRRCLSSLKALILNANRWAGMLAGGAPPQGQISVFYGHNNIPRLDEPAHGGIVKLQYMQGTFPDSPRCFNLLYMVSSALPADWAQLLWLARRKGARVVWNQNGVGYSGWHGPGWEQINRPMAKILHTSDHVFYQSRFCKLSADLFLGERNGPWEILYNAVDTTVFTPTLSDPDPRCLVLLLGGNQYQYYRIESALRVVAILARLHTNVRLLVTGKLRWFSDETAATRLVQSLLHDLGIVDRVVFLGSYPQIQAPVIYRQAHLLLHTKYNDPCPGLVVEAMACGVPVVYSRSGGVPELVGDEAGVGVPTELSWEQDFPPAPEALAEAVLQAAERRAQYAEAARQRAVEHFDLRPWLKRHKEVFEGLISK